MRQIAVVTTFSAKGWKEYARRMVQSFKDHWPEQVHLFCYPDTLIEDAVAAENIHYFYPKIAARSDFITRHRDNPTANGFHPADKPYNYRFDAVKFCHKPFVLDHFANHYNPSRETPFDAMVWLDADSLTHRKVPLSTVRSQIAPPTDAMTYLGRVDKYSECGFIYFNLNEPSALECIRRWANVFATDECFDYSEWHDSFLFDIVRKGVEMDPATPAKFRSLTRLPRRKGGGHPFVNSFLGEFMDHCKGNRKVVGPRPNDMVVGHDSDYWKKLPKPGMD